MNYRIQKRAFGAKNNDNRIRKRVSLFFMCERAACYLMVSPLLGLQYLIGFDNHIFHIFSKPFQIFHGFFDTLAVV